MPRVVTFDARNHGRSLHASPMSYQAMADDLAGLLSSDLGVDRASLLGHSMGGRAAMLLALQRPERVEKLFVVDISPINYGKVSFFAFLFRNLCLQTLVSKYFFSPATTLQCQRSSKPSSR